MKYDRAGGVCVFVLIHENAHQSRTTVIPGEKVKNVKRKHSLTMSNILPNDNLKMEVNVGMHVRGWLITLQQVPV